MNTGVWKQAVLSDKLKSKIQLAEMTVFRCIIEGVYRSEKIRNSVIRERLKVAPLVKIIEQR